MEAVRVVTEVFGAENILPQNDLLDAALTYADMGWGVFPTHNGPGCSCWKRDSCQNQGKHPRTRNGVHDATTDMGQIETWWRMWPESNIGIRTGQELLVLDFDGDEGSEVLASWSLVGSRFNPSPNEAKRQDEFLTPRVITGNGVHLYFKAPQARVRAQVGVVPGVDIRVGDSYVIAPPSVHATGRRYEWEIDHSPVTDMGLAEVPPVVMSVIGEADTREKPKVPKRIRRGKRHDLFYRLASGFWAYDIPQEAIERALIELLPRVDQPKGDPFDESHIKAIVKWVTERYEPGTDADKALRKWQEVRKQLKPLSEEVPSGLVKTEGSTALSGEEGGGGLDVGERPSSPVLPVVANG